MRQGLTLFQKVSLLVILLAVFFTLQYFHETGHVDAANKQGLDFNAKLRFNILGPSGNASPLTKDDCERFNSLPVNEKLLITHAGFWRASIISLVSFIILLATGLVFFRNLIKNQFLFALWGGVLIFLIFYIASTYFFDVYLPIPNDWHRLYLDCSKFS